MINNFLLDKIQVTQEGNNFYFNFKEDQQDVAWTLWVLVQQVFLEGGEQYETANGKIYQTRFTVKTTPQARLWMKIFLERHASDLIPDF